MVIGALDACSLKVCLSLVLKNHPEQKNKYLVSGVLGSEINVKKAATTHF